MNNNQLNSNERSLSEGTSGIVPKSDDVDGEDDSGTDGNGNGILRRDFAAATIACDFGLCGHICPFFGVAPQRLHE